MQFCQVFLGCSSGCSFRCSTRCSAAALKLQLFYFYSKTSQLQVRMKAWLLFICINIYCIYRCTSIKIIPKLKKNIWKFGYRINYKYEGILAHSIDRFYVVTKFILSSIKELKFSKLNYDSTCAYPEEKNGHTAETQKYILDLACILQNN